MHDLNPIVSKLCINYVLWLNCVYLYTVYTQWKDLVLMEFISLNKVKLAYFRQTGFYNFIYIFFFFFGGLRAWLQGRQWIIASYYSFFCFFHYIYQNISFIIFFAFARLSSQKFSLICGEGDPGCYEIEYPGYMKMIYEKYIGRYRENGYRIKSKYNSFV